METHSLMLIAAFFTQLKWNSVGAFIIDRAQKAKHPALSWISTNTPWVTRIVSFLFASAAAVNVHAAYNPGAHSLLITGLSATAIFAAAGQIAQNYAIQHGWGKLFGMDMNALKSMLGGLPAAGPMAGIGLSPAAQPGGAAKP